MQGQPSKRTLGYAHRDNGSTEITVTAAADWSDAERCARFCLEAGERAAGLKYTDTDGGTHVFDVLPARPAFEVVAEGVVSV